MKATKACFVVGQYYSHQGIAERAYLCVHVDDDTVVFKYYYGRDPCIHWERLNKIEATTYGQMTGAVYKVSLAKLADLF